MEQMQIMDLTGVQFAGQYGHDKIDALTKPGRYILPFKDLEGHTQAKEVEVIAIADVRMQIIMVKTEHGYFDFYYNGNERQFKHYTNDGYHFYDQWAEENAEDKLPIDLMHVFAKDWEDFWK